ncbi:MAG: isoprenyl transferase [Opitutales bacterium]|nr:isoprenyl transferase [Opitutales bacterium]
MEETSQNCDYGAKHVAIIMDGNGRWAKARNLPRAEGHRRGVENVRQVIKSAQRMGVRYLTLYAFSAENWNRPALEVNALMLLLERFLKSQIKEMHRQKIQFRVIGDMTKLPGKVQKLLNKTTEETRNYDVFTLILALNYGARQELLQAIQAMIKEAPKGEVNWETVSAYLYTRNIPDPDLIIRTSGEYRLSNFLLLQAAYSEFYFTDVYWPDFDEAELHKALKSYKGRERRFGKTGDQLAETNSATTP